MEHEPRALCRTPSSFLRRSDSLWSCPVCGKIWVLRRYTQHGYPDWEEVNLVAVIK